MWDAKRGTEHLSLRGHKDWFRGVVWSSNSRRLATASADGTVRIWDAESGRELRVLEHETGVRGVAWSPDNQKVVTACHDRTARIWDVDKAVQLSIPCVHRDELRGVDWSPDGQFLATSSRDCTARIWPSSLNLPGLISIAAKRTIRQYTKAEKRALGIPVT